MTPAKVLGISNQKCSICDLIDTALAAQPITPVPTASERRNRALR